jgi:hypothetical protein
VAAHLDVVGCGLWVVGCDVGLQALVSYDTHFVDQPCKRCPPPTCRSNETPAKVSIAETSSYTGDVSAGFTFGGVSLLQHVGGWQRLAFLVR